MKVILCAGRESVKWGKRLEESDVVKGGGTHAHPFLSFRQSVFQSSPGSEEIVAFVLVKEAALKG